MRKRIVFVDTFQRLSPRRQEQLETFIQSGYEVRVIAWNRTSDETVKYKGEIVSEIIGIPAPIADHKALFMIPFFYIQVLRRLMKMKFDAIHCCHLVLLPLALAVGRIKRVSIIYDAMEPYAIHLSSRFPRALRLYVKELIQFVEGKLVSSVDGILTIDSNDDLLLNRFRLLNNNVEMLYNTNNKRLSFDNGAIERLRNVYSGRRIIIYIGGETIYSGIFQSVKAIESLRESFPDVKLLILGLSYRSINKMLANYVYERGLKDHVEFVGFRPHREMMTYLKIAQVGLAPYQPVARFLASRGNARKIFDYMSAGLPIIGPDNSPIGQIISEEQCGILVDTTSPEAISQGLEFLLVNEEMAANMGLRGKKATETKYNWETESKKLLKVYEKAI